MLGPPWWLGKGFGMASYSELLCSVAYLATPILGCWLFNQLLSDHAMQLRHIVYSQPIAS